MKESLDYIKKYVKERLKSLNKAQINCNNQFFNSKDFNSSIANEDIYLVVGIHIDGKNFIYERGGKGTNPYTCLEVLENLWLLEIDNIRKQKDNLLTK